MGLELVNHSISAGPSVETRTVFDHQVGLSHDTREEEASKRESHQENPC